MTGCDKAQGMIIISDRLKSGFHILLFKESYGMLAFLVMAIVLSLLHFSLKEWFWYESFKESVQHFDPRKNGHDSFTVMD